MSRKIAWSLLISILLVAVMSFSAPRLARAESIVEDAERERAKAYQEYTRAIRKEKSEEGRAKLRKQILRPAEKKLNAALREQGKEAREKSLKAAKLKLLKKRASVPESPKSDGPPAKSKKKNKKILQSSSPQQGQTTPPPASSPPSEPATPQTGGFEVIEFKGKEKQEK